MIDKCIRGRRQQSKLNPRADYACFEDRHFTPFVVTTQPYEPLSHATLEWLKENQDKCDVLQVRMEHFQCLLLTSEVTSTQAGLFICPLKENRFEECSRMECCRNHPREGGLTQWASIK